MAEPSRRMPTLNALRVFEAVARLGSFKAAANELYVTPAAVSFQIRQLEDDLQVTLFERQGNQIALTTAGQAFLPKLSSGFALLHEAFNDFLNQAGRKTINVTAGPAVTSQWLVPQMRHLRDQETAVDVSFKSSLSLMDLSRDNIDFALRFGTKPNGDFKISVLAEEYVVPVANPEVAETLSAMERLAELELIHDQSLAEIDQQHSPGWAEWASAVGMPELEAARGLYFSQSDHAVQAAVDGAGVALARLILAGPEINAGRLVVPFGPALPTGLHYYLLEPDKSDVGPEQSVVRDWLVNVVGRQFQAMVDKVTDK